MMVPRGFTRFYILALLKERPMTGKEIIEEAARRSDGAWIPSPGIVYPMLSKLLVEGLIEEAEKGYRITEKGERVLKDYVEAKEGFEKAVKAMLKLLARSNLLAQDAVDRMASLTLSLWEGVARLGRRQRERYLKLVREGLERLEKQA